MKAISYGVFCNYIFHSTINLTIQHDIKLLLSYLRHRPHAMLNCPDDLTIIFHHLHVAPYSFVYHPYLKYWDVHESNLI